MPRFSIFLVEYTSVGGLKPQSGITSAFLQPQADISSANPSSKTADSNSVALTQSSDPGHWYADLDNPSPRYDLYINGNKQSAFSGSEGFEFPSSKSIYVKKNLTVDSTAYITPELFTVGSGKLATPDGGQTWPKFSTSNKPAIFVFPISVTTNETPPPQYYRNREAKVVGEMTAVSSGILSFYIALDPNGPDLSSYTVDLMIVML